jgi:MFS superfamily sulfate permease-like transporter
MPARKSPEAIAFEIAQRIATDAFELALVGFSESAVRAKIAKNKKEMLAELAANREAIAKLPKRTR